jgi:hypothetical protein
MNRESDEECLALIASIRARAPLGAARSLRQSDIERLIDNLEARIAENQIVALIGERDRAQEENDRLHAKVEEVGRQLDGRQLKAMYVAKEVKPRGMKVNLVSGPIEDEPEDCPCGTETCREAWRELRQAKADEQNFEQPLGDPPRSQADLDADAEEDRQRSEIKAHWRELIREEVAAEVERQIRLAFVRAAKIVPEAKGS